jgi:DedD protein
MTSALQNRLVGTIIVVALVVIFVPEFLDGEKRTNQQAFVNVPPVAELVEVERAQEFDSSNVEQELSQTMELVDEVAVDESLDTPAERQNQVAKSSPKVSSEQNRSVDVSGANRVKPPLNQNQTKQVSSDVNDEFSDLDIKDSGYVVQLGSFRHQKNVKDLLKTLNNAGYRAYSRPVMTSIGELTKVFVGPELDREKLELALPHLQKITNLKGKITPFEVSAG